MSEAKTEKQTEKNNDVELDLNSFFRDFIRGLLRFWYLVAVLALVGGSAFFVREKVSYHPMYRSVATFTVATASMQSTQGGYNFYYDSSTAEQLGLTFPHILSSQLLTDAIKADLNTDTINGSVSATTIKDSNMVTMTCTSSNPQDAQAILESAVRVYPSVARFVIGDTKFNMIETPSLPTAPYNEPNYLRSALIGTAIGCAAGIGLIVLYAILRKTVHKSEDLQNMMNLPCLATLPFVQRKVRKSEEPGFPSVLDSSISAWFNENMETLRLRVEKEFSGKNKKVLLVTGTMPGEGKSVVAANLAFKMVRHGKKVLLVDGDLRKQDLGFHIGIEPQGNMEILAQEPERLKDFICHSEDSGIDYLGGAQPFEKVARFLARDLYKIVMKLRYEYDCIILDAPPAGSFEDVTIMRRYADSVLYVVRQDYSPRSRIADTVESLVNDECDVLGFVFNGVTGVLGNYGSYGYGYGRYGHYGKYGYYGYSRYGKYGHYGKYGKYGKYGYGYGYGDGYGDGYGGRIARKADDE